MKYVSLNHNSSPTSFMKAVINGLAPDKGLYYPQDNVTLSKEFIESIKDMASHMNALSYVFLVAADVAEKALDHD